MFCRYLPYGYIRGNNGLPIIDEEKRIYINKIFEMASEGVNENGIVSWLNQEGVKTSTNKARWWKGSIYSILENTKYAGDETFPAIVSKETFEKVKEIITEKNIRYKKDSIANCREQKGQYPFSAKIICGVCGSIFTRETRKSKTTIRHLWRCRSYVKGGKVYCRSTAIDEREIEQKFIEVINQLKKNFNKYIKDMSNPFKPAMNEIVTQLDNEILRILDALAQKDQEDAMDSEEKIRELLIKRTNEIWKVADVDDFEYLNEKLQKELMTYKKQQVEFDGELFKRVVKRITFTSHNTLLFQFINGIEIEKEIRV